MIIDPEREHMLALIRKYGKRCANGGKIFVNKVDTDSIKKYYVCTFCKLSDLI